MNTLLVVHCIDTEGPLTEDLKDTFLRLKTIYGIDIKPNKKNLKLLQNKKINLNGIEEAVSTTLNPKFLNYNSSWSSISKMLDEALNDKFRRQMVDDFDGGWVYSWHCLDHIGYIDNPRNKELGYGKIFNFYKKKLQETESFKDEINWHFHPRSINNNDLSCGSSYTNSYNQINYILARRILDDQWFPVVNRPGFHTERQDSNLFLEQWIPFDYANQFYEGNNDQTDLNNHRFGDWKRASRSWRGYNPSHEDYQLIGLCKRKIFRCLNVGTRFNNLEKRHVFEAFKEADEKGTAILSFCNHDYRDIRDDIRYVRKLLKETRAKFKNVKIKFCGAEEAAVKLSKKKSIKPILETKIVENMLEVKLKNGKLFGSQPFLAIKHVDGKYYHDNLDIREPGKIWSYTFDDQTFNFEKLDSIGVGSAGENGKYTVSKIKI